MYLFCGLYNSQLWIYRKQLLIFCGLFKSPPPNFSLTRLIFVSLFVFPHLGKNKRKNTKSQLWKTKNTTFSLLFTQFCSFSLRIRGDFRRAFVHSGDVHHTHFILQLLLFPIPFLWSSFMHFLCFSFSICPRSYSTLNSIYIFSILKIIC